MVETKRQWHYKSKMLGGNSYQLKITYITELFFKEKGKIKTFCLFKITKGIQHSGIIHQRCWEKTATNLKLYT